VCVVNPISELYYVFIHVNRRVKGYTGFVEKYVTGAVYLFLFRITSRVVLVISVGLFVRMNAVISKTIIAFKLHFDCSAVRQTAQFTWKLECHPYSPLVCKPTFDISAKIYATNGPPYIGRS